ncbi:MAG: DUF1385 domain-containing protein [Lachnospiraceae bacterium]
MKPSGIGGQAVMEGIMMKNGDDYAVAVRKADQQIEIKKEHYESFATRFHVANIPFIRGIFNFADSLNLGMSTLMWSSNFFEDGETEKEEPGKFETWLMEKLGDKAEKFIMTLTVIISVILAVGIFFMIPVIISSALSKVLGTGFLLSLVECCIRVAIFVAYMGLIAFMPDIKRTYMYHGAEHKCINCIEHNKSLTVKNVRESSRFHKRCGTSFLFIIVIISAVIFMLIHVESVGMRLLTRIVLIPVIAGISYEILRFAGRHDNWFVDLVSKPGLCLQRLTTKEPTDDMIEVAIAAVNEVFDWQSFLNQNQ